MEKVQENAAIHYFLLRYIQLQRQMSKSQQRQLAWGDIVRIHGVNLTKQRQEESKGLIISKGFTDSNIYYQKYSNFQNVNFYRQSLFQVLPRSNFDIHDQLNDPNLTPQNRELLKMRAKGQIDRLYATLDVKKGENIKYGAQAVFRHVESNSYMKGVLKAADSGDGAFTIEVCPDLSSQIVWKIRSHRSYQIDGDEIYFDDELLIYHEGSDCYMNFAQNDRAIYLDKIFELTPIPEEDEEAKSYERSRPFIKTPNQKRISIINENKSKCYWKFIEHCTLAQYKNEQKIKSHDIVYFQHTKNKGCISCSLNDDTIYLKETVDQKQSFESFWELIPNVVNQLGPESCNDFSARNIVTGKYLTYKGNNVSIRSKEQIEGGGFVSNGLINLICTPQPECLKLERGQLIPRDQSKPRIIQFSQQLYELYNLTDVVELTEDSFLIVKVDEQTMMDIQFVISSHEPFVKFLKIFSSHMINESAINKKRLAEVKERMISEIRSRIMTESRADKLDEKQIRQKVAREFQKLKDSKELRDIYDFQKLEIDELENVRKILELIAGKIYGTSYDEIISSGNTANLVIQKILVETGTTELLIEIIYQLFIPFVYIQENSEASQDRAQKVRIHQIFERAYKLLQKIVVGNSKNKFYLSRWVDLFLQHSNAINRQYIQECLVGILQNNPQAIEATISKQKIQKLIDCFFEEAKRSRGSDLTTKYLRLFSTFIKCEDRVLKENQNIILEDFFKKLENPYSFRFKVQSKEDEVQNPADPFSKIRTKRVQIALGKQDFSPIPKYFKDWGPKWNYFLAFVNLLADVCMDKNNLAIQNVSALVTFQIVSVILFDPEIEKLNQQIREENNLNLKQKGYKKYPIANVHEPFVRIAHYIYIYNSKFTQIKTIKNISRWYRHQGEEKGIIRKEDINKTKRAFEGQKEQEEKFYLVSILKYIEAFIENCDQNNANLDILYTVLNLFRETVLLGLWESITQFRKLIPLLIMRIIKIDNQKLFNKENQGLKSALEMMKTNKESLCLNKPQILLNINCKIKTTDIFKYINELEIDIRLRYMMNFFKGLYEATESFEDYNKMQVEPEINDEVIKARNLTAKEEFLKSQYASILGEVKKISEDQDIMLKENIWCNKFKQLTPFQYVGSIEDMSKDRYLFQGEKGADGQPPPSFDAMVLALFELPVYKDQKLLSSALRMLRSIFEQRKDLIDQFKEILVCGKGNLLQVYMTLKYMREKFDMLTNQNILKINGQHDDSFSYYLNKPYDSMEKINANRSGILQDLFFLSRTLKEDINLKNIESLMNVDPRIFDKNIVYNHLSQKQRNNKLFQSVNIAEGIYVPLMQYIKIIGDSYVTEVHRKILFSIYQYLSLLCFNNLQAKQKLMTYVELILPHLKRRVGAANFLYQVTLNNKMLISNTSLVKKIIDGALEACIDMQNEVVQRDQIPYRSFEKSQILFALRGILLLNDEGFRINQQLLMNRFQDNKFKKLIYKNKIEFTSKRENFTLSPEESYVATFFQLFSVIVESKNFINIGKLQNIHPYTYCLQCLKNTNRWQIRRSLRAYINRLYYVNKDRDIFLFEEFIRKEFKIINDQLEDLITLHRNKFINDQVPIQNGIRFKFAQSQVFEMILEIFITIQEMLLKPQFLKILKREILKQQKKSQNQRQIHDQFIRLLKHIGCLNLLYPTKSIINAFIKQIYLHISEVMVNFSDKYLEKHSKEEGEAVVDEQDDLGVEPQKKNYIYDHSKTFFSNLSAMIRDIKAKKKKDELKLKLAKREQKDGTPQEMKKLYIDLIFQVQGENLKPIVSKKFRQVSTSLYKPHIQTANSRIFKVLAKPTLTENQQNIELNRRLSIVKQIIDQSPVFRKLKEDEFFKLVTTLTNIDRTSQFYYQELWLANDERNSIAVVNLVQIFTKSFKLIMDNPSGINDDQKIFIIKIARCYITEAVEGKQSYKLSVDKWDPDYYSGDQGLAQNEITQFVKRQNLIKECGGSEFIQSIFRHNNYDLDTKRQLLNETLLFGIAYLFNGNQNCQNSLLDVLINDPENYMLLSIKRLILNIGTLLIEIRKTKEIGKLRKFAYSIVDTYDFFNIKDNIILKEFGNSGFDKFQAKTQKAYEFALCRIFRFLQLFCENGNIRMKKFLLAQTNDAEGQVKKTNSINFIETTTLLLRKLFKIMNDKVVGIPQTLLDFINEITQLPCIDNQIAFMKSTFFEDLSYLADFFMSYENLTARKFEPFPQHDDDPLYKLRDIYQKGIDLALCNFEGNDNILIWQFLSKCQPKFLWVVIKQNLIKILADKIEQYGIERKQDDQHMDKHVVMQLLARFNEDAITAYIKEQQKSDKMLNEEITNILSVLYILKKIDVYKESRYEVAYYDKDKPNFDELEKYHKADSFKNELIDYVEKTELEPYPHIKHFLNKFDELILSIQISSFNGKEKGFQFIYFPKHPVFNYLAAETRDSIMMRVKRETQRDKQTTLLNLKGEVYDEIELNYKLKYGSFTIPFFKKEYPFAITSEYSGEIRKYARYVSFLICFLMMFFIITDHDTEEMTSTFNYRNLVTELILRICCSVQLLLTVWFCYIWLRLRMPLAMTKFDNEAAEEQVKVVVEEKKREYSQLEGWDLLVANYKSLISIFLPYLQKTKKVIANNYFIRNIFISFYSISKYESGFLSILMFVFATIMGNFFGVEWYTIHLFDVFTDIPELTNIFKAILNNFKKLALLSFLAGVFILVFNVISLNTYTPVIWEDDLPAQACEEIIGCVLELYTSGAIGDDMDEFAPYRFVFDIVYVVFMEMMFQNIVGGIMIDAFSELKENDSNRDQDKSSKCYICGMTKSAMEKSGTTFDKHTRRHHLWNYLYYLYCLKLKSPTDFTGLEFEIDNKVKGEDVEWFPAMGEEDTEGEVEGKLTELTTDIDEIIKVVSETVEKAKLTAEQAKVVVQKIISK